MPVTNLNGKLTMDKNATIINELLDAGEYLFRMSAEEYKNCESRGGFYSLAQALDGWRTAVKLAKKAKLCSGIKRKI